MYISSHLCSGNLQVHHMISPIFPPLPHSHTLKHTYLYLHQVARIHTNHMYITYLYMSDCGHKTPKSPFSSPPTRQATYTYQYSGCADSYTITNLPTPPFPPLPYTHTLTHTCVHICQVARIHTNQERLATYLTEGVLTEELLLDNGHQVCQRCFFSPVYVLHI